MLPNRRECCTNFRGAEGLDREEQNQYAACCSNYSRIIKIGNDYFQALHRSEDGLSRSKYAVRHDHFGEISVFSAARKIPTDARTRYRQDANNFEKYLKHPTLLHGVANLQI